MDWKQILSLSFDELTDLKRDEIYEALLNLRREQLDRKHYKKLIDLMQHILNYKGDMVNTLLTELEGISNKDLQQSHADSLIEENTGLKEIVDRLESEKSKLKQRLKELSEENVLLQRRNQDGSLVVSEREDSPNLLSEIDKQEELLLQISQKNKHIKRLLRDVETLESESNTNLQQIQLLETNLREATQNVSIITSQMEQYIAKISEQEKVIEGLNISVQNLNDQIGVMEVERAERESEIQVFGARLEERAVRWRQLLQEKDDRLDSLRTKYEVVLEQNPGYDIDADREGLKRMAEAVSARDHYIADLEEKISDLSKEMTDTTELLNRLANERESVTTTDKGLSICAFCSELKSKVKILSDRCVSLQEMVNNLEEDNILKSKLTLEAQKTLASFKNGEDGLAQALARNVELQSKIESRDKHIRSLVSELNVMQTCTSENEILRQRLGIPDDEIISTTGISSKQKKQKEINQRLALKLRASEEMRLQLKLEKHDLRQQLAKLTKLNIASGLNDTNHVTKGGQTDSSNDQQEDNLNVLSKDEINDDKTIELQSIEELELRYAVVVEENENLRVGMHEILEQLRNYNAQADHIVIDTPILEQLLHALDARSVSGWYHPAMRMQNELIAAKEREVALLERIRVYEDRQNDNTNQPEIHNTKLITDTEPIPTTTQSNITEPNRNLDHILKYIISQEAELKSLRSELERTQNEYREALTRCDEYKIHEQHFEELTQVLASNEDEQCAALAIISEKMAQIKIKCNREEQKLKFMQDDYKHLKHQYQLQNESKNNLIFELRKILLGLEKKSVNHKCNLNDVDEPNNNNLKQEIACLKSQMSRISASALNAYINLDDIKEINIRALDSIGVINADYTLEFITKDELNALSLKCKQLTNENTELKSTNLHKDELLMLSQTQIESLQRTVIVENEEAITTKHLVVDLQSESQEKYIIAKMARELKKAVEVEDELKAQIHTLKTELTNRESIVKDQSEEIIRIQNDFEKTQYQSDIKLKFICKSYADMRQNFHHITPLYPVLDFMKDYAELLKSRKELRRESIVQEEAISAHTIGVICERVQKTLSQSNLEDKLLIIKYESHQAYLEEKLTRTTQYLDAVHQELDELKLRSADWTQHWNTIELLFGQTKTESKPETITKETQSEINKTDNWTNTENHESFASNEPPPPAIPNSIPTAAPRRIQTQPLSPNQEDLSLASQLKQAMYLASARSALLLEHENRLGVAHARVKSLEKIIEEHEKLQIASNESQNDSKSPQKDEHILSATIASLQNLLHEKDTTLNKYQEMLQTERQNALSAYEEQRKQLNDLQNKFDELQNKIIVKDNETTTLKDNSQTIVLENTKVTAIETESMPDTYLEELFLDDRSEHFDIFNTSNEILQLQKSLQDAEDETRSLRKKLQEVSLRESGWERTMCEKDKEIAELAKRLHQIDMHDIDNGVNRRDIDQLREMLDEKDRHINDLTDTLNHFHDDQRKFMNDTTLHSVEQVSQLSADLNRLETTNRILNTQLEAVKRQLASVGQRETQARELIKTLKTQLIRRPVISMKTTDRSTSNREEQLQKRINNMENELQATREELRKQNAAVQFKRSKDADELALWSKQKRFQQMSDTLKQRLLERDIELEKLKNNLATSKTAIARLEREKNILNDKLNSRSNQQMRYCTHPSCPNVHLSSAKRTSESPDSYVASNHPDYLHSSGHSIPDSAHSRYKSNQLNISDNNQDIVDAQRTRIETQQRKIVAMELEGRGNSAMSQEIERLQEKLSTIEAQNIRLEAKNLHLQLNNDMLQQSDQSEKDKRQIKHLEDYIIALKSELAQTQTKSLGVETRSTTGTTMAHTQQLEQTILAMRRVLERLKAENKILKDSKIQPNKDEHDKLRLEFSKVQQLYSEALDKISALQIELEIQTGQCMHCKNRIHKSDDSRNGQEAVDNVTPSDWSDMKEKLIKKTQLLEKAKILLSRAAAKEKQYRDQIAHWKRRCSELQNVPIIEEEPINNNNN